MKAKLVLKVPGYEVQEVEITLVPLDRRIGNRGPRSSNEERAVRLSRILEMYKAGYSPREIADQMDVSREYVRRLLHKHGVWDDSRNLQGHWKR